MIARTQHGISQQVPEVPVSREGSDRPRGDLPLLTSHQYYQQNTMPFLLPGPVLIYCIRSGVKLIRNQNNQCSRNQWFLELNSTTTDHDVMALGHDGMILDGVTFERVRSKARLSYPRVVTSYTRIILSCSIVVPSCSTGLLNSSGQVSANIKKKNRWVQCECLEMRRDVDAQ